MWFRVAPRELMVSTDTMGPSNLCDWQVYTLGSQIESLVHTVKYSTNQSYLQTFQLVLKRKKVGKPSAILTNKEAH